MFLRLFWSSLEIFGISDHDLMFEIRAQKEIEGEADVDDLHGELYVRNRVSGLDFLNSSN